MAPRRPQDGPRSPKMGPKMAKDGPKTAQDGRRWVKIAKNGVKIVLRSSKMRKCYKNHRKNHIFEKNEARPDAGPGSGLGGVGAQPRNF